MGEEFSRLIDHRSCKEAEMVSNPSELVLGVATMVLLT
jgi:hypothetical protein